MVRAGEQLTEGSINPNRLLRIRGREAAQVYLLSEIQLVYRSQGVNISDKHIEVIIRQMTNKVRVVDSGDTALLAEELVNRLTFQDEYLFKFSAVFLTAHGALVLLARSAFPDSGTPRYEILLFAGSFGLFLALVWIVWIYHNDYWHSVWSGSLKGIERRLGIGPALFALNHAQVARTEKRHRRWWISRGHRIAMAIPVALVVAWGTTIVIAACHWGEAAQPGAPGSASKWTIPIIGLGVSQSSKGIVTPD